MEKYTITIKRHLLEGMITALDIAPFPTDEDYVLYYFETIDFTLKIYDNTKYEHFNAVVTGSLPPYLKMYYEVKKKAEVKKVESQPITTYPQIGSDETGFGDFFGPLIVVSALVRAEDVTKLKNHRITDSKKLSDSYILSIGPFLINEFKHVKNVVSNEKFNELTREGYNMNKMKAMLHVNVLSILSRRENVSLLLLDRFVSEDTFASYVNGLPKIAITHVASGELNALSIALASVIARYYFLTEIQKLNKQFGMEIPLGASEKVDDFARAFLERHGPSALKKITKHNFQNFKRVFQADA